MKIIPTQLRIGNVFKEKYSGQTIKVIELTEKNVTFDGIFTNDWQAESIQLTEEWIVKLGLEKSRNIYLPQGEIDICVNAKIVYIGGCDLPLDNQYFELRCEYVHELQNLYFALTGQELTLKS